MIRWKMGVEAICVRVGTVRYGDGREQAVVRLPYRLQLVGIPY